MRGERGAGCLVAGAWCCAGCRVRGAGCGVRGAGCGVRGAGCGTQVASRSRMGAKRYHDLDAWKLANELKQLVYGLVDSTTARDDRKFCDQIKDSAASASRNLAEGFACYRHPEFARCARTG